MECADPEANLSPLALHSWLTAVLYNSRTKMNPLWNNYIVGGLVGEEKKPYLGVVNHLGVAYQDPFIVTGIGSYYVRVRIFSLFHLLKFYHCFFFHFAAYAGSYL